MDGNTISVSIKPQTFWKKIMGFKISCKAKTLAPRAKSRELHKLNINYKDVSTSIQEDFLNNQKPTKQKIQSVKSDKNMIATDQDKNKLPDVDLIQAKCIEFHDLHYAVPWGINVIRGEKENDKSLSNIEVPLLQMYELNHETANTQRNTNIKDAKQLTNASYEVIDDKHKKIVPSTKSTQSIGRPHNKYATETNLKKMKSEIQQVKLVSKISLNRDTEQDNEFKNKQSTSRYDKMTSEINFNKKKSKIQQTKLAKNSTFNTGTLQDNFYQRKKMAKSIITDTIALIDDATQTDTIKPKFKAIQTKSHPKIKSVRVQKDFSFQDFKADKKFVGYLNAFYKRNFERAKVNSRSQTNTTPQAQSELITLYKSKFKSIKTKPHLKTKSVRVQKDFSLKDFKSDKKLVGYLNDFYKRDLKRTAVKSQSRTNIIPLVQSELFTLYKKQKHRGFDFDVSPQFMGTKYYDKIHSTEKEIQRKRNKVKLRSIKSDFNGNEYFLEQLNKKPIKRRKNIPHRINRFRINSESEDINTQFPLHKTKSLYQWYYNTDTWHNSETGKSRKWLENGNTTKRNAKILGIQNNTERQKRLKDSVNYKNNLNYYMKNNIPSINCDCKKNLKLNEQYKNMQKMSFNKKRHSSDKLGYSNHSLSESIKAYGIQRKKFGNLINSIRYGLKLICVKPWIYMQRKFYFRDEDSIRYNKALLKRYTVKPWLSPYPEFGSQRKPKSSFKSIWRHIINIALILFACVVWCPCIVALMLLWVLFFNN